MDFSLHYCYNRCYLATLDKNMGIGNIIEGSEMEQIHFAMLFDEYVDEEVRQMEETIKEDKILRKVCLIKTICYPLELLVTYILLGKIWTAERVEQQKVFKDYLKKKIDIKEFQIKLMDLTSLYLEKKHA